jgi:hypothetical protein
VNGALDGFIPNPKLKLFDQVGEVIRFKHYSIRTERTSVLLRIPHLPVLAIFPRLLDHYLLLQITRNQSTRAQRCNKCKSEPPPPPVGCQFHEVSPGPWQRNLRTSLITVP